VKYQALFSICYCDVSINQFKSMANQVKYCKYCQSHC